MSSLEVVGIVLAAVVVAVAAFVALLPWLIRPIVRLVLSLRYGIRVRGRENIPRSGPAVVVSNHVTWIDGLFLCASAPRRGRILANAGFFTNPVLSFLARRVGIIPIPFTGPKAQRAAITAAREALRRGEVVAIMPEGQLTRTGFVGPFYRGLEVILKGFDSVPVVPTAIDNLWGSILSFQGGTTVRKRPVGLRRTVAIAFGPPLTGPPSLFRIRLAILEANVEARELGGKGPLPLETIDLALPHLDHAALGLLAASAADYDQAGVTQPGQRPGSVGLPPPGVALRVVDESGGALPEETCGRIEARVAGRPGWIRTNLRGELDRDGFLTLA
ncbi:MAG TPA: 1-acyl-sn-glycerol-3-phosphate acyltransferase [Isosphaeraceae bacterium]